MLKITPDPKFTADVKISVPGQEEPAVVQLTFKYLSRTAMAEWHETAKDKALADALAEIVLDWSGFDAKFTAKALSQFLDNYPAAGMEILSAYSRQLFESRVKN